MELNTLDRRRFIAASLAGAGLAAFPRWASAAEPDLMPKVRAVIERNVGVGKFPGMLAALGLPGKEAQFLARGADGFDDSDPITPDSLFRIYSMTKPITGMAIMLLIEQGRLGLDQPLADILPKYAKMNVQVTPDGSITDLRPARTAITIRHLLTHTAGLGYTIIQQGPLKKAYEDAGLVSGQVTRLPIPILGRGAAVPSLTLFADRLADMPLVYEPGTKWSYSVGIDLLGRVIEVVSGMSFDKFLKRHIFEPCGMNSTWFHVPKAAAGRLTTNYGALGGVLMPIDKGSDSIWLDKPAFPFGGSGLVSSPRDYDRFLRMITQYGKIDGKRVLGELTVRVATSDLLPEGVSTQGTFAMGSGFGAAGRVGKGDETGLFGWSGAAGTIGMVDMRRGLRTGLYVQFMPPTGFSLLSDYTAAMKADVAALPARL